MAKLIGAQRMVLQAILELPKDSSGFSTDAQVAQNTQISLEDVRNWLETLEGEDYVNVARTEVGLRASITAQGRLALKQYRPFSSAMSSAQPVSSPPPSSPADPAASKSNTSSAGDRHSYSHRGNLPELLAELLSEDDARDLVDRAGLDARFIVFRGHRVNIWNNVLREARNQSGKPEAIVDLAIARYPDRADILRNALNEYLNSNLLDERHSRGDGRSQTVYQPAPWEKICVVTTALLVVLLVGFLVVRNLPFRDPNLVVLIRTVLSAAVAVLGATIPGFLHVDLSTRGLTIRAGGALALFVLSFFFSPRN
jgi:hypothetical protein